MNQIIMAAETSPSADVLDTLFSVGTKLIGYSGDILNTIVANPLLVIPIAAGLVGIGIGLIGSLRHAW